MRPIVILSDSRHDGTCRSCGASIEWATVAATKKQMPFDRPIVLLPALMLDSVEMTSSYVEVDMSKTMSHFSTCPDAEQWRRQ